VSLAQGWTGRFFEDFEVEDIYQHPLGGTVSEADNTWFTLLTMNTNADALRVSGRGGLTAGTKPNISGEVIHTTWRLDGVLRKRSSRTSSNRQADPVQSPALRRWFVESPTSPVLRMVLPTDALLG
jgi:hypothetical protein